MNNNEFAERFPESEYAISGMHDLAAKLLEEAEKFDFLTRVFGVNEDVLGRYSFRRSQISPFAEDELLPNVRVDLY